MFDLTRRNALKLLGAAAAFSFTSAPDALAVPSSGNSLFDEVAFKAAKFHREEVPGILDTAQYASIFEHKQATQAIERVVHTRFADLGQHVRVHDQSRFENARFIWNFEPVEYGLGFPVVADDDPREVVSGSVFEGPVKPIRLKDVASYFRPLTTALMQMREIEAADILNKGRTYDASVGGDGMPLCSESHPWDRGVWSNTFSKPLNASSLKEACEAIRNTFVDDRGVRVNVRPKQLVVPVELMLVAERLVETELRPGTADNDIVAVSGVRLGDDVVAPYAVIDYLTDNAAWFITTNITGMVFFERRPYQITCEYDREADAVLVTGHERRIFGCHNPRAIFGSFPNHA